MALELVVNISKLTVMLRFSARRAYLLLVPQGRALIRDRALISFLEKQPNVQNKTLILKRNNNRNCDSNK